MPDLDSQFEIYRINVVDEEEMSFEFMGRNIRSDQDILAVLKKAASAEFDLEIQARLTTYRWAVREYFEVGSPEESNEPFVAGIAFGRSILQQQGQTITEDRVEDALTTFYPPSATIVHILFYMERHLAIAEYNSVVMHTQAWRDALHTMLDRAAQSLELRPGLRLEPVPRDEEILRAFQSFQRLTRLRVNLRIPNPEMDRRTERLRREMAAGQIREYTQDMKNPAGLSQSEGELPHATAAMAQAGYKEGEVIMTGIRDGRRRTVRTGKRAARIRVDGMRNFGTEIGANATNQKGQQMVRSILEEVNRVAELPTPPEQPEEPGEQTQA
jgi:hypothetical protein